ncbi:MAG: glycosyltransferase family 4 protein [Bacteroidota bacterium]
MKRVILAVTNDLVSDQRAHKVSTTLTKMGFQVILVGRRLKNSLPLQRDYTVKRFNLFFNKGPLFYAEYNIRLFFFLLFHSASVITANDTDTLPATYLVSKIKRNALVYDAHEYFTGVPELVNRKFIQSFWKIIEKIILPDVRNAMTVNHSIASIYEKEYGIKMKVVRNVPLGTLQENSSNWELIDKAGFLLYQGAVNVGRGLELMIDAVSLLDEVFVIAGDGDIIKDLQEKVSAMGLQEKVIFTGKLPLEKLAGLTKRAAIGISLEENLGINYYYALPNKIFDYINSGVPVLVSDLPEMSSLVEKYNVGLVLKKRTPAYLANILKDMLNDKNKRLMWYENIDKAKLELCWEKEEQHVKDLYKPYL